MVSLNRHRRALLSGSLALLILLLLNVSAQGTVFPTSTGQDPYGKINRVVLDDTADGQRTSFVILLADQANVSAGHSMKDHDARGWYVYNTLKSHAERTQVGLRAFLSSQGVSYQSYWAANMIVANGDRTLVEVLAARDDVSKIESNRLARQTDDLAVISHDNGESPNQVEWGVQNVRAPEVWTMGYRGEGIVIGNLDSGVRWTHNALKPHYRGWNGSIADHNYNWRDAVHVGGGPCGPNTQEPCDANYHGTLTTGSAVGDDGAGNQIGVAPGAKWIACRSTEQREGTQAQYTECLQFAIAPTDLSGQNPNAALRPHVLNNGWRCSPPDSCNATLETSIRNVEAAGIFFAMFVGNSGPGCSTVYFPPARYETVFSTGAIDINNQLASFSSRGPVLLNGVEHVKPNIAAPGVNIRSSTRGSDSNYTTVSGTSMSSPHLAGVVALLWDARPDLERNITETKTILQSSANPDVTVDASAPYCGGTPTNQIPNNYFGYGRLDALAAINWAAGVTPTPMGSVTPTRMPTGTPTSASTPTQAGTVTPAPITVTPFAQQAPQIDGNIAVWEDNSAGSWDIWAKDLTLGTPFPVTTAALNQRSPAISGDLIVWQQDGGNGNQDIYGARIAGGQVVGSPFPIATSTDDQISPVVSFNPYAGTHSVVWQSSRQSQWDIVATDVYTNNGTSTAFTLTSAFSGTTNLNPAIDYPNVVWESIATASGTQTPTGSPASDILGYNLLLADAFTVVTSTRGITIHTNPDVSGSLVVWQEEYVPSPSRWRIAGANIDTRTIFTITESLNSQENPAIYGSTVVYDDEHIQPDLMPMVHGRWTILEIEIPPGRIRQISNAGINYDSRNPAISSGGIIWEQFPHVDTPYPKPQHSPPGAEHGSDIDIYGVIYGGGPSPTPSASATNTPTIILSSPSATRTPRPPTPTPIVCNVIFTDVPLGHTFFAYVHWMACRSYVSGYPCGGEGEPCPGSYYRPNANVTRGQLAKIISNAAGFQETIPPNRQTFADVPNNHTFWVWIERLSGRAVIGGYRCGGEGEPCDEESRPYFRWGNNATRGQISKMVSSAAGLDDDIPPTRQSFADVPPDSTFWLWIERLYLPRPNGARAISGYPCGGEGEPCDEQSRPYFRPGNDTTRGQLAKIATITFGGP